MRTKSIKIYDHFSGAILWYILDFSGKETVKDGISFIKCNKIRINDNNCPVVDTDTSVLTFSGFHYILIQESLNK